MKLIYFYQYPYCNIDFEFNNKLYKHLRNYINKFNKFVIFEIIVNFKILVNLEKIIITRIKKYYILKKFISKYYKYYYRRIYISKISLYYYFNNILFYRKRL